MKKSFHCRTPKCGCVSIVDSDKTPTPCGKCGHSNWAEHHPAITIEAKIRQLEDDRDKWKRLADRLALELRDQLLDEYGHRNECQALDDYESHAGPASGYTS